MGRGKVSSSTMILAQESEQQTPPPSTAPRIELTSARVRPDAPIFVNALIFNSEGAEVHSVFQTIQFSAALQFKLARLGIAANLAGAELKVVLKDASGATVDKRELARSVDLAITAKQSMAEGPLVELEFKLTEPKDQVIALPHKARILDGKGKENSSLIFSDGEVVVSESLGEAPRPAIGCFFFTH